MTFVTDVISVAEVCASGHASRQPTSVASAFGSVRDRIFGKYQCLECLGLISIS